VLGRSGAQTPVLEFRNGEVSRGQFFVELAKDRIAHARGLSHRPSLARDWGMFFVFPRSVRLPFTMQLMRFPLDLVFIGADGRVADIIADAQPKELALTPSSSYRYVLELNAGAVRARGIRVGDTAKLIGVAAP
jgi:hypothetical protein